MSKITPEFIVSFETNIETIKEGAWARVLENLKWDRLMKVRQSSTKREILTWLLETVRLYPEGDGGNTRFDDMVAASFAYENGNAGAGLELTRNEIEDNQMDKSRGEAVSQMSALNYAASWAEQAGIAAAFYPEQQLFNLIVNGTSALAFDGVSFFNANHPVNPNGGGGTYSNIITSVPINASPTIDGLVAAQSNFAKALAGVASQKMINGMPRYLKPTVMVVPTALQYRAELLTSPGTIAQGTNILANRGIEVIVNPLLDAEPDVYYLGVEDMLSNSVGPFIWSERKPFTLSSYRPEDEAALNRRDEFEWTMKGRNYAGYGLPYLFYRCTPS